MGGSLLADSNFKFAANKLVLSLCSPAFIQMTQVNSRIWLYHRWQQYKNYPDIIIQL